MQQCQHRVGVAQKGLDASSIALSPLLDAPICRAREHRAFERHTASGGLCVARRSSADHRLGWHLPNQRGRCDIPGENVSGLGRGKDEVRSSDSDGEEPGVHLAILEHLGGKHTLQPRPGLLLLPRHVGALPEVLHRGKEGLGVSGQDLIEMIYKGLQKKGQTNNCTVVTVTPCRR